jgi:phospholipid/cholesterol/gamma-HCH transport system substrate-binding protein
MSSSVGLNDTYAVSARFDNIGGLKPRAAVRSAGVVVGRVSSVTLDASSYEAVVVIDIDQRYRFPKDTSAKILTAGLLGEQYIGLEPGGDTAYLEPGNRITLTQSAVVLENIIGQMLYSRAAEGERK